MILGIGVDVVATDRIGALAQDDGFESRVFTAEERRHCRDRSDRAQALAARFAAKEACLKALGTGWGEGVTFQDVEVHVLPGGKPALRLTGAALAHARTLGVENMHLSLTHEVNVAAAVVVLEGSPPSPAG